MVIYEDDGWASRDGSAIAAFLLPGQSLVPAHQPDKLISQTTYHCLMCGQYTWALPTAELLCGLCKCPMQAYLRQIPRMASRLATVPLQHRCAFGGATRYTLFRKSLCYSTQSQLFLDVPSVMLFISACGYKASPGSEKRNASNARRVMDIVYIGVGFLFFALSWRLVALCERL